MSPKRKRTKQQSNSSSRAHINRIRTCVRLTILQHGSNTDQSPGSLSSNSTIPKREAIQQQRTAWIPTDSASIHEIRLIKMSTIKNSSSSSFTDFHRQHKRPYLVCPSNQTILLSLVAGAAKKFSNTAKLLMKNKLSGLEIWSLLHYSDVCSSSFSSPPQNRIQKPHSPTQILLTSNASAVLFSPLVILWTSSPPDHAHPLSKKN